MSDYYHAEKMRKNGCPKSDCSGEDCLGRKYNFKCNDCGMRFP